MKKSRKILILLIIITAILSLFTKTFAVDLAGFDQVDEMSDSSRND